MKQTSTLENDLAIMIDVLAGMVEDKDLSQTQMEKIMEKFFNKKMGEKDTSNLPSQSVVNKILNYSQALRVLKPKNDQVISMIIN
jgi:hypothetical protein